MIAIMRQGPIPVIPIKNSSRTRVLETDLRTTLSSTSMNRH